MKNMCILYVIMSYEGGTISCVTRGCYMSVCRLVCLLAHDIDLYECILYLCVTGISYVTDMNIIITIYIVLL